MMIKRSIVLVVFIALCLFSAAEAQQQKLNRSGKPPQRAALNAAFSEIEQGLASGNVAALSRYFNPQTYLSLSNGVSGYYSSNQAYYIMEDFFSVYKVLSFRFENISTAEHTPYATGIYGFETRGRKDTSQVYISLKNVGGSWKITQISIN